MYYIYRITNLVNGKTYIGQHKFSLGKKDRYMRKGKLILKTQKKYGIKNFKKDIIEVIPTFFEANVLEKYYIAKERAIGKAEYNIADGGQGSPGVRHSDKTKQKLSEINKGKTHTKETKKKISESNKGRPKSDETRKKLSEANTGKHLSNETKRKISETKKGSDPWNKGKKGVQIPWNKGKRGLQNAWNKGIPCSEETKKKISEAQTGKHWYNNGVINKYCYECPEGFTTGRI